MSGALLLLCCTSLLAWMGGPSGAFGQSPARKAAALTPQKPSGQASSENSSKTPATVVAKIEKKLAEARVNLANFKALGEAALTNVPAGVSRQDVETRRMLLYRLVRLLEQQLSNIAEIETTKSRRAEVAREAQAWTRFAEPPPYSILLTDELREKMQAEQLKIRFGESAISTIDQLISENRKELNQAEEEIRQLNEQLEVVKDPTVAACLSWRREFERLHSQAAAAAVGAIDSGRELRQEALAESRLRLGWLQRQLIIADAGAKFAQTDLDKVIARIESDHQQLERELSDAHARSNVALQAVTTAREEQRRTQTGPAATPAATARAAEELAARDAQLETVQTAIRTLRVMLEIANVERNMWSMRFAAYDSRSVETLSDSERQVKAVTRRVNLWKDYYQQQAEVSPSQIELLEARVQSLAADSDLLPLARDHLAALRERELLVQRLLRRIDAVQRLTERWAEGLRAAQSRLPVLGRIQNLSSDAGSFLEKLWTFELFTAEDTITVEGQTITGKRSITLDKIIMAVLILMLGIWITGLISRIVEPVIIRRLKIEANLARLIRHWLRAFMVICLIMFSLVSVKIPLTVFAFAGGALAIGMGFGLQTILKNFVSGLILLFERPFQVGNVLDVGGQCGTITEIGLRASVLRLWNDTEILIPNSSLVENNVTNWTYSNRKVRFTIKVGAAYGSDTRRVIQLLSDVAGRHGVVEKEPKPQVLFTEFGESALTFELRYWVDVIKTNAAQVASDLRQMIASAFAENGIVIAFPQRDLHLDTARPLAVEIVTGQEPSRTEKAKTGRDDKQPDEGGIKA